MTLNPHKTPSWKMPMIDYLKQKAGLNTLASAVAAEGLIDSHDENMRVQRAENSFYIRQLGGEPGELETANEDGKMRQIILGDVNHLPQEQKKSSLSPLVGLALGALIPGVGIAGYIASQYLNKQSAPVVNKVIENTSGVNLGLGRIEDYE